MRVCLMFGFYGMRRQKSNFALSQSDPSCHACEEDVLFSPSGLLLVVKWTKMVQTVGNNPVIPIQRVHEHPMDPVKAYLNLLAASPTTRPNQPILTISVRGTTMVVTISMLPRAFNILLEALHLDPGLYSLHSLRRGSGMAAYRIGTDQLDIKRHAWTVGI